MRIGRNEPEVVNCDLYWGILSYISYISGTTKSAMEATCDLTLSHMDTPGAEDAVDWSVIPVINTGGKRR